MKKTDIEIKYFNNIKTFCDNMDSKFERYKKLGERALEKGEYKEALQYFDQAVYINSKSSIAWTKKAAAEIYLQKLDDALESINEALNLDRKNSDAWFNKGLVFDKRRKYDEALSYYENALRYNPRHIKAINNKGTVLGQLERWDEAEKYFKKALDLDPKNEDAKENLKLLSDYRSGKHKSRCFIATAAYGSPVASELKIIRNYRDRTLMKSTKGRNIINIYYKISPPIAGIISRYRYLKAIVRLILGPFLFYLSRIKFKQR